MGFIVSQVVPKLFSVKYHNNPDGNRELLTHGLTNLFSSFFGTYPVFGSITRSRIQNNIGGQTILVGPMAAVIVFILATTSESLLKFLPLSALGAIVTMAAISLIEVNEITHFRFIITVFLPIESLWVIIALAALFILSRITSIDMCVLGKVSFTCTDRNGVKKTKIVYVDFQDYPEAIAVQDTVILCLLESVEFYNCGNLAMKINELMMDKTRLEPDSAPKNLILDFSHCSHLDGAGSYSLRAIAKQLDKEHVRLLICGLKPSVNQVIRDSGVLKTVGSNNVLASVDKSVSLVENGANATLAQTTMTL